MNTTVFHTILKKSQFIFLSKLTLFLAFLYIIYTQLFLQNDIHTLYETFQSQLRSSAYTFLLPIVIFLMPFNWFIESYKWKLLINQFNKNYSLRQAVIAILSGLFAALLTPGRVGEYGGRLINISLDNAPKALLANFVSSLAQNIVNIAFGIICTVFFLYNYFDFGVNVLVSFFFTAFLILSFLVFLFVNFEIFNSIIQRLPSFRWKEKIISQSKYITELELSFLLKQLFLSTIRYITYASQYVALLFLFEITPDIWIAMLGVGTIFLLQSNLPLPPVLSIFARGEIALLIWASFSSNSLGILCATFVLWFINLLVPALSGSLIFLLKKSRA